MNHRLGVVPILLDKATSVRHQAVLALQRLQDPINPTCRVIKSFMFHLELDPSSEVRRGILQVMARSNLTIPQIIDRTRDVKDTVRKQAYLSLARVKVRSLTIKDREGLLSAGLKDRSEMVRNCVAKVVLPSWLHNLGGTYLGLLNALYVENYVETSTLVLKTLFNEDAEENDGEEVCRKKTAREAKKEMGGTDNRKCTSERRRLV
ncbi:unnamed protein product [Timema podura]|uniref:Condensin complex subunit 1 C-terminal domain-containing protein n=1 Tax=Timema podura TaxID=61482 RepID=A0ABN7NY55_TIMPD|nr:unnamed protein product [Timema podura]